MTEELSPIVKPTIPEIKIQVDYQPTDRHGRLTKKFCIFDGEGGKAKLSQKDAIKIAKAILRIAGEKA